MSCATDIRDGWQYCRVPEIRKYRPSDRADVAEICLKTGDSGADATGMYVSDDLLADIYVLPYVELEPDLALVVDTGERVAGYLVATADTRAFIERFRAEWLPGFTAKYSPSVKPGSHSAQVATATSSDEIIQVGMHPERMMIPEIDEFPAHLHIDLLAELQGQGVGRRLIRALLAELAERGVPGVHLGVSPRNTGARAFYSRLGFRPLPSDDGAGGLLGIRTDAVV
jgi:ribosomal protein S18 acetylase RimI-like enzyme